MKQIQLYGKHAKGEFVMVDDKDYEYLIKWKWYIQPALNTSYAFASVYCPHCENSHSLKMHRMIMKTPK